MMVCNLSTGRIISCKHQTGEIRLEHERLQRPYHSMKRKGPDSVLVRHLQIFAWVTTLMDDSLLNFDSCSCGNVEKARALQFFEVEAVVQSSKIFRRP